MIGTEERKVISTGIRGLDDRLGGGIPVGSLTLIEGHSSAGKSVFIQQTIWGALRNGYRYSFFTSENTVKSLVNQMQSLALDILDFLLLDRLRVLPMEVSRMKEPLVTLLQAMHKESDRDVIGVDSLTSCVLNSSDNEAIEFFEGCKGLTAEGVTVFIVLHSHALSQDLLIRLRALCDAHLRFRVEEIGTSLVKTVEVSKVRGADKKTGNIVSFEVEPGWGLRVIPVTRAKA